MRRMLVSGVAALVAVLAVAGFASPASAQVYAAAKDQQYLGRGVVFKDGKYQDCEIYVVGTPPNTTVDYRNCRDLPTGQDPPHSPGPHL